MNFLRENQQIYNFVNDYVMAKITGTDKLAVDAQTDAQAIADAQSDVAGDIILRPTEEESSVTYVAPDEIPMEA